ncbi:TPA: hypothetical protein ACGOV5_001536 [Streptococcus suis]
MKSLTDIAHDIAVSLLPKSLDETMTSAWNENKNHYTVNDDEIIIHYAELHCTILERLKKEYGENGENYPR